MRRAFPTLAASMLLAIGSIALPRAALTQPMPDDQAGAVSAGKAAFAAQGCYLCHGYAGQGAKGTGATIAPVHLDDAAFDRYVRAPRGSMPGYGRTTLSDADLTAIMAYLRSLPAPRSASAIPLLAGYVVTANPAPNASPSVKLVAALAPAGLDGKAAYLKSCSGCHGANREGGAGPSLQAESQVRDSAGVAKLIMAPPPGMPKLYPQPLDDAHVRAIAAYVVSH